MVGVEKGQNGGREWSGSHVIFETITQEPQLGTVECEGAGQCLEMFHGKDSMILMMLGCGAR